VHCRGTTWVPVLGAGNSKAAAVGRSWRRRAKGLSRPPVLRESSEAAHETTTFPQHLSAVNRLKQPLCGWVPPSPPSTRARFPCVAHRSSRTRQSASDFPIFFGESAKSLLDRDRFPPSTTNPALLLGNAVAYKQSSPPDPWKTERYGPWTWRPPGQCAQKQRAARNPQFFSALAAPPPCHRDNHRLLTLRPLGSRKIVLRPPKIISLRGKSLERVGSRTSKQGSNRKRNQGPEPFANLMNAGGPAKSTTAAPAFRRTRGTSAGVLSRAKPPLNSEVVLSTNATLFTSTTTSRVVPRRRAPRAQNPRDLRAGPIWLHPCHISIVARKPVWDLLPPAFVCRVFFCLFFFGRIFWPIPMDPGGFVQGLLGRCPPVCSRDRRQQCRFCYVVSCRAVPKPGPQVQTPRQTAKLASPSPGWRSPFPTPAELSELTPDRRREALLTQTKNVPRGSCQLRRET